MGSYSPELPPVHPRAYGEQAKQIANAIANGGSPPCVRGAACCPCRSQDRVRFTPVRTGSRVQRRRQSHLLPVHPRAYGEQGRDEHDLTTLDRFTPVRTGSSRPSDSELVSTAVHPRAYGEQVGIDLDRVGDGGSPPCVRGAERLCRQADARRRFTPVRTGSRNAVPHPKIATPVHPRAYGEQEWKLDNRRENHGSPPCVRGADQLGHAALPAARFTPVRTGSRLLEHRRFQRFTGSPPCVRGAGKNKARLHVPLRFTPVRTGSRLKN